MDQSHRRHASPTVTQTLENSRANLAAGQWEDVSVFLRQRTAQVEARAVEIEAEEAHAPPMKKAGPRPGP